MTQISLSRRQDQNDIPVFWFAMLFAVVSYLAVSARAILNPFEMHSFFDAKRLLSVVAGAFLLWLSIRDAEQRSGQGPRAQILAVLNVAIPGALCLFLAREAWDLAASGEIAQRLALNLRWMLNWIGYFAAAVGGFLALSYHRQLQAIRVHAATGDRPDFAKDRNDIKTLLMVLRAQTGYETADWNVGPDARDREKRLAQIDHLLDKLGTETRI